MLFSQLNLTNIKSELIELFNKTDDNLDIMIPLNTAYNEQTIIDFNNRNITPSNINEIISFCDFLLLENTLYFLVNNCTPTEEKYILNNENIEHFKLPKFMSNLSNTNIVNHTMNCDNIINWLRFYTETIGNLTPNTLLYSIKLNNFDCVLYAYNHGCIWTSYYYTICAKYNRLDMMKYMINQQNDDLFVFEELTGTMAVKYNNMECCDYLISMGFMFRFDIIDIAAELGHLNMIQYLRSHNYQFTFTTLMQCSMSGNLECLQYLYDQGCRPCGYECNNACIQGNVKCLEYLCSIGCNLTEKSLILVLQHDHVECFKFLFDLGYSDGIPLKKYLWKYKSRKCMEIINLKKLIY